MARPMKQAWTIARKILAAATFSVVAFGGTSVWLMQRYTDSLYQEKRVQIQRLAESAAAFAAAQAQRARAGEISDEAARVESLAAIAAMRYGKDGYFWVNDTAAVMIMHPILPDWNGTYKGDVADANGVFYIRELANMARDHGQGIVEYQFRKPGNEKPTPKFSYVKLVPEWGWAVGTGIYVDDVKAEAAGVIRAVAIAAVLLLLLAGTAFGLLARSIVRGVREVSAVADRTGELSLIQARGTAWPACTYACS